MRLVPLVRVVGALSCCALGLVCGRVGEGGWVVFSRAVRSDVVRVGEGVRGTVRFICGVGNVFFAL